ncbi:MAG: phosphodiester glycosidase family protein [Saprospiraceae bacterium]
MSKISFPKGITNLIIIICYSFFLSTLCTSCSAQTAPQKVVEIDAQEITYRNQKFDVVKIDLRKTPVQFYWKNKNGKLIRSLENLKNELESDDKELLFAMNAGMYQRDRNPQGLYIENEKTIKSLDTLQDGYGNFYLQPNGVFYLKNDSAGVLPSNLFSQKNITPTWATQSGPMLLINEKVHPIFQEGSTNLNIRNGVGVISKHEIVFVISHKEVNLFDFAMLFKEELNCKNALYLDGFVSRAYIPPLNRKDLDGNFGVMIGAFKTP